MYVSHKALAKTSACRTVLLSAHVLPFHVFPTVDQIIHDSPFTGHIALSSVSRIRQPDPSDSSKNLEFNLQKQSFLFPGTKHLS